MKKLMTSTIILLPLIILAIMLVSGAIKALMTHIYVDRVEFVDEDTLVLVMDDEENPPSEQLEVNVLPLKAENRDLIFTMDDESIATVDASGKVVAKFYGETYVNVMSAEDNLKKDRRRVLVTDDAVHKIEITEDCPTDIYEAKTEQLAVVIYPREAKERGIKWTSSNPDVLAISETGIIQARGYGEATITATSVEKGEISDSVTIKCHSAIEEIKTETGVRRVETALETEQFPKITKSPLNADVTISYTSDNPDIATVDENGKITFAKPGKVTITATATDFGNTQTSTSVEYLSTLHYYGYPFFEKKAYTVDFDEYYDASQNGAIKALDIPFAEGFEPEETYKLVTNVVYSIQNVLDFDKAKEEFRFVGEMPAGTEAVTVTVYAQAYDTKTNEVTEQHDAFTLTVQRRAQSVAVGYNGTKDAQSIVTSDRTLIFGTDSGATAPVSVFPANHTDKLSYTLEDAAADVATLSGGTLTFRKAGKVTVLVSCKYENGEENAESRVTVSYAPAEAKEHKKGVTVTPPQEAGQEPAKQQVLLSMEGETKEEGILYFAEPAGTTVTYAVVDAENAAVELQKDADGVQHIVPRKGGFATVKITVSPAAAAALFSAPRSGEPEGATVYTVEVYVDKHISAEDLSVLLNGKSAAKANFGAAGTSVTYQFDVDEKESAMQGKVLYVTYEGLASPENGDEGSKTLSGSISFPAAKDTLAVTFGVKYSEKAVGLGAKGTLPTVTRTITRNAESVTFSYRGTDVSAITTKSATLTFKLTETVKDNEVYVNIGPDNHTDVPEYSLVGEQSGASITPQGVLTFTDNKPCTVTVQIQLRGKDGEISATYTITVNYAPRSEGDTVITFPADNGTKLLLSMGKTAKIDYVVPAGADVECTAKDGVVSVAKENGEWTLTPQKGGFDTVTFTVNGTAYTVDIYVDRTVENNFTVEMGDGKVSHEVSQYYSTKENSVSFTVTVKCADGAMEGKRLYVKYGDEIKATGNEGDTTFTGTITFPAESSTLPVEFGVQYAESANEYGAKGALPTTSRTVARNATGITFSYKGTQVTEVPTTSDTLTFKTSETAVAGEVYVNIQPANHTDTVKYSLKETGVEATIGATSGELKFIGSTACNVTVQIQLVGKDGNNSVSAEIQVHYTPRGKQDKEVTLPEADDTPLNLLLFMNGDGTVKDKGKIVYVVPADAHVECTSQDGVVSVAEENGEWTITPLKGGFGTVTYKVTGGADADKKYTIHVYVNRAVTPDNFSVELQDTTLAEGVYGTTKTDVSFTVTVNCQEGAMQGKQIYVKYGGQTKATGTENSNTFTGTVTFPVTSATLPVEFGVQYTSATSAYEPGESDDVALASVTRTLARNAESITVTYGGVATAKIVTKDAEIDFNGKVTVAPAAHTDNTLAYVLENGDGIATIAGSKLTFQKAGTVTVKVQTKRGDTVTLTKSVTVTYEPLDGNKEITLGAQTQNIVLTPDQQALIYFTEKEGTEVTYKIEGETSDVINLQRKNGLSGNAQTGIYHITALKGGFATVKVTVSEGGAQTVYTVNVYVNARVAAGEISVQFEEKDCTKDSVHGTTADEVSFTVKVTCAEGAMAGKQIFVEYGSTKLTGDANAITLTGTINFANLGSLTVTFGVEYAADTANYGSNLTGNVGATATRELGRNATSIAVRYNSVETEKIVTHDSALDLQKDVQIDALPANHTDTFAYELNADGIASVEGNELKFTNSGTVTLVIKTVRGETVTCSTEITVTYEPLDGNIEINLDSTTKYVVLTPEQEGRIYFTVPKGVTNITYRNGSSSVIKTEFKNGADDSSGVYHIVPEQGGFATLTVTVVGGDADATYTINIYVDAPVTAEDISVQFNGQDVTTLKTSKTSVTYSVTVADKNGSMAGKSLHVLIGGEDQTPAEGTLTKTATVEFGGKTALTFIFVVQYEASAEDYKKSGEVCRTAQGYTVTTTGGKLDTAPTVTYTGGQLDKDHKEVNITFDNIGNSITFKVDKTSFDPADYALSTESLEFVGDDFIEFTSYSYLKGTQFTLKAKKCTVKQYDFTIGGQTFKLNITVKARVQEIQVTCGKTVLGSGEKYKTLLGELTFAVKAIRHDGEPITNPALEYAVGNSDEWKSIEDGQYTLSGLAIGGGEKEVKFRTKDGSNLSFTLLVKRVQLNDFSLEVGISFNDGNPPVVIGRAKSLEGVGSLQYTLPASNSGTVALYIVADADYLGGFGMDDQFKEILPAQWQPPAGGKITHTLISTGDETLPHANINLTVPSEMAGSVSVEIGGGDYCLRKCTIEFTPGKANIAWFEFPGFDSNNSTDVYMGYQQVRVFAKHSDYGKGESVVDYIRIPVVAYEKVSDMKVDPQTGKRNPMTNFTDFTWKLTSYTDDAATDAVVVTQNGTTVTYNGVEYTIEGSGVSTVLKKGDVTIVADGKYASGQPRVPWVDTVSEAAEGYVRVYFGAFTGLSESDVQNDLFGNFGEEENWSRSGRKKDIEGKDIVPSDGAFSFLRLEGGDGRTNAHFNFNVLEDDSLVNVFNATGYYAHSKVVLHENLYGPNELTNEGGTLTAASAAEQDLILTKTNESEAKPWLASDSNVLGKTIIYGNGYQVNFEAKTAQLKAHGDTGTSRGVHLQKVINADVKASNPKDSITKTNQPLVMVMEYAYYSTIEYYSKISPWGAGTNTPGYIHLKNTVLRCCAQSALQLYYSTSTAYIENVVLNECVGGFNSDSKDGTYHVVYNFKGFVDVLNYMSYMQLGNSTGAGALLMDEFGFTPYMQACDPYLEWLGKTPDKLTSSAGAFAGDINPQDWWGTRFANVFLYNRSVPSHQSTVTLKFWDESTGKYDEKGESENGIKVTAPIDVTFDKRQEKYKIFVYADTVDSDGGLKTGSADYNDRDMSQLFSENRYIRLLCQYKTITGKGYNATPVKNYEHIRWHTNRVYRDYSLTGHEREDHIENLKKSLEDVKWPDGTTPADAGVTAAIALNELLSETVIPSKSAH